MTVSGHRSETSIRHYAQTSDQQKVNMSDTISSALGIDGEQDKVEDLEGKREQNKFAPSTSRQQDDADTDSDTGIDEFLEITSSQVERIFTAMGETSTSVLDDSPKTDGSIPMAMPLENRNVNIQNRNATFQFNNCVVNIYN